MIYTENEKYLIGYKECSIETVILFIKEYYVDEKIEETGNYYKKHDDNALIDKRLFIKEDNNFVSLNSSHQEIIDEGLDNTQFYRRMLFELG